MTGLFVQGSRATSYIDSVDLQAGEGYIVPNVSIALLDDAFAVYPDNTWYPLSVGCLGIGAPDTVNQSFTTDGPLVNASLVPGYLWDKDKTNSNSFGMHIGSTSPQMSGSLYFGGYDQNRIVGDIITKQGDFTSELTLKDISIKVFDGESPWDFGKTQDGLLAAGNSSIGGSLPVLIDGCSPYLSLPTSTCDALAEHLPVTYKENLGLYTWNTNDTQYSQIVNSASGLTFTFLGSSNTETVSISVPFRQLNLTLSPPLVDSNQQYFPCYTGGPNSYTLGRAFLQSAFVGANWNTKNLWLAQAPGPNIPASEIVEIQEGDDSIQKSSNDWMESWRGSWVALPAADNRSSNSTSNGGLSTGAQAGIGVGVGIAGLALVGALMFFFLRRRKAAAGNGNATNSAQNQDTTQHSYYEPVKNPTTPGIGEAMYSPSQHNSSALYSPGQYSQNGWQGQQQYAAELHGSDQQNVQELPAAYPQNELPGHPYQR